MAGILRRTGRPFGIPPGSRISEYESSPGPVVGNLTTGYFQPNKLSDTTVVVPFWSDFGNKIKYTTAHTTKAARIAIIINFNRLFIFNVFYGLRKEA
jgi:hypothetical protein